MADNVAITPGSGAIVAADDIGGGILVQRVKAVWGADGSANDPTLDDGIPVEITGAATSTLSNVGASVTSVPLLASNTGRRGASIYNDSASAYLYVKHGATASLTSFTVRVRPNGLYELPGPAVWRGAIDGIWSAAVGTARITETA